MATGASAAQSPTESSLVIRGLVLALSAWAAPRSPETVATDLAVPTALRVTLQLHNAWRETVSHWLGGVWLDNSGLAAHGLLPVPAPTVTRILLQHLLGSAWAAPAAPAAAARRATALLWLMGLQGALDLVSICRAAHSSTAGSCVSC